MKGMKLFFIGLLAVGVAITACGGGGGGGGAPAPAAPAAPTVAGTVLDVVALPDLDPAGTFSAGIAINNNPMVVGVSDDGLGILAAKWDLTNPPTVVPLNPLPLDDSSAAYGLNDDGIAVGESGNAVFAAVYWPAGLTTPTALSATGLFVGGNSAAYSINNLEEVVGEADDGLGNTVAVFWDGLAANPVMLDHLAPGAGESSSAYFISNGSMIVGESRNSAGLFQAVVWIPDVVTGDYGAPVELATPVGASSAAFGLSLAGNIVGEVEDGGIVQGVVWNTAGALLTNLGNDTSAQAIGQAGTGADRIVGYVDALTTLDRATIWNRANPADNQVAQVPFSQAYGINDSSYFVGVMDDGAFAAIPQ